MTDIFDENIWILIVISLKFVLKGPIKNIAVWAPIMIQCRPGDKPLSGAVMVSFIDVYMRHSAPMS